MEKLRLALAGIVAKLEAFQGVESLTAEQVQEIKDLRSEADTLKGQIEAKEMIEATMAEASISTRKTAPAASTKVEVKATTLEKNGGFKNMGEFLNSVKNAAGGNIDKRFQNTMFEKNGEDGGFLVPDEMMGGIAKKIDSDESLLSKTTQFNVSGNSLSLITDENQPFTGGVQAYWTQEGAQISDSKHSFGVASWRLHKLAAMVKTTDELMDDAVALESYIRAMAPVAIIQKINEAILGGNGVGKPKGILNSDFKIAVAKESAQTADTIVARNVIKMYNRMIPSSRANAVWFINPEAEDQLRTMTDDNGNFIYLAPGSQLNQSPYGLLMGRPVLPLLGGMKALGDEGDIIFADLSYYYAIIKSSGIKNSVSTHLLFDRDQTAYKFIFRVDGSCPFKSPVQVQNGSYTMSGFITLADRA
jgi:HK97 family phage major capsid protein